jgi:hypothetical protein
VADLEALALRWGFPTRERFVVAYLSEFRTDPAEWLGG